MGLSAVMLFFLYRYLVSTLGVAKLGIWSVVLASASASRLAELGLSVCTTRFVAKYIALVEPLRAAAAIETAALTLSVVLAIVSPAVYHLLTKILAHIFNTEYLLDALSLLPYALLSFCLTTVASVFQSGLDGCQRMDVRAGLVLTGQMLQLALAFWLVPHLGLIGLAWAQMGQGLFLLVFGWWLLRKCLPQLSRVPFCWRRDSFREMLGYGLNVQFASVSMILFDPLAKIFMTKFGGVSSAGYFEMANQVVFKGRALIVSANQAIVPKVAQLNEIIPQRLPKIYRDNMQLIALVTLPASTLLFAWAGIVSRILLGGYNTEFVFFLQLITVAWTLNVFASPAYFANMGTGNVGWNTLSHVTTGVLNVMLGFLLGSRFGAKGVAFGYAAALVVGSWLLIVIFQKLYVVSWKDLASREHLGLASASLFTLVFAFFGALTPVGNESMRIALLLLLPPLLMGVSVWFHPLRKRILTRVLNMPARGSEEK